MKSKIFEVVKDYYMDSDILYLHKDVKYKYQESVEIGHNIILDFDKDYNPVAIEILDASEFFNVSKYSLTEEMKGIINVHVGKDIICIKGELAFLVHNKKQFKPFVQETTNNINLPLVETDFEMAEA